MTVSTQPPERLSSAIYCREVVRIRTHGPLGTETFAHIISYRKIRASAPQSQSAAPTPPGSGRLRTAFERTRYPIARAVRIFSLGEGHRRLIKFLRAITAPGSLLSSGPFVKHRQEPTSILDILFRPKPLSIRAAHVEQHAWSSLKCLTNALKGQSR